MKRVSHLDGRLISLSYHYISIFDLDTEEKRNSRYLGDVPWIGHGTSFQLRCKSQITSIITSATKIMSCPNYSITSQYLTYLRRKKGTPGTWAM